MNKDELFKDSRYGKKKFKFGEDVANSFDDMVSRSVPFYDEIQRMLVELAEAHIVAKTNVYDIGCSTGNTLRNFLDDKQIKARCPNFIGIDGSRAMLKKAREKLQRYIMSNQCELVARDINKGVTVTNASVVVLSLTLQFVKPCQREFILAQIFNGLREKGCLILVEKIYVADKKIEREFQKYYRQYKLRQGYSIAEINNKKNALKNVLIPFSCAENLKLLEKAGFKRMAEFFRWYSFLGIVAWKD